uniref:Uncharacterized protein n=1 Tax=Romanomermis culicivorax TaxID=13658 RepID=A0A915KNG5_ROMCU
MDWLWSWTDYMFYGLCGCGSTAKFAPSFQQQRVVYYLSSEFLLIGVTLYQHTYNIIDKLRVIHISLFRRNGTEGTAIDTTLPDESNNLIQQTLTYFKTSLTVPGVDCKQCGSVVRYAIDPSKLQVTL